MKNIKFVYLILGLGIGLIFSNILNSLYPQLEYVDLSDALIIERAEEMGYVSIKENISLKPDKENQDKENREVNKELEEIGEEDIETKEERELKAKDASKEDEEQEIPATKDKTIEMKIIEGDTLKDIARKLLELGLIVDEEKFILTVEEKEMDKKFAYGKFSIPLNSAYDQIIELLTR